MIFLDTTVLVYAKGADHPLRDPCRDLLGAVAEGTLDATTTPEVIQEFTHVRSRRRDRADAVALARDYAELLSPLAEVGRRQLEQGLRLFEASATLGAFDAVLASLALDGEAAALVSADRAFASVDGLAHVFPDTEGVASLLG